MSSGLARARAMRALTDAGLSAEGLTRADSVTNEAWLTPDYAVRVNRDASLRLYREAVLSQVLPAEVGYPPLVQHGGDVGDDWLVMERRPGISLSRAWPTMTIGRSADFRTWANAWLPSSRSCSVSGIARW